MSYLTLIVKIVYAFNLKTNKRFIIIIIIIIIRVQFNGTQIKFGAWFVNKNEKVYEQQTRTEHCILLPFFVLLILYVKKDLKKQLSYVYVYTPSHCPKNVSFTVRICGASTHCGLMGRRAQCNAVEIM